MAGSYEHPQPVWTDPQVLDPAVLVGGRWNIIFIAPAARIMVYAFFSQRS